MHKKSLLLSLLVVIFAASASAFTTTQTNVSSTFATVSISSTTDLYAYEINFDYPGASATIGQKYFLGNTSVATYGSNIRDSILSVYGSRLDSTQTGVNGSGQLFNVTHTGNLTLRYTLGIYANGTEVYTYYNTTGDPIVVVDDGDGGGGGGGTFLSPASETSAFSLTPSLLKVDVNQGETSSTEFTITNNLNSTLEIASIEASDSISGFIAAITPERVTLLPGESYTIGVDFFARKTDLAEAYTGQIVVTDSTGGGRTLNVIVEINEDSPLFDVVVDLEKEEYAPGELVISVMEIENFGELRDIDVLLYYAIQDFEGNTISFKEESYAIENYKLQLIGRLELPEDTEPGQYVYYARARYGDVIATGSQAFTVSDVSFSPSSTFYLIGGVVIGAILLVTIVLYFALRKPPVVKSEN